MRWCDGCGLEAQPLSIQCKVITKPQRCAIFELILNFLLQLVLLALVIFDVITIVIVLSLSLNGFKFVFFGIVLLLVFEFVLI